MIVPGHLLPGHIGDRLCLCTLTHTRTQINKHKSMGSTVVTAMSLCVINGGDLFPPSLPYPCVCLAPLCITIPYFRQYLLPPLLGPLRQYRRHLQRWKHQYCRPSPSYHTTKLCARLPIIRRSPTRPHTLRPRWEVWPMWTGFSVAVQDCRLRRGSASIPALRLWYPSRLASMPYASASSR